MMTTTTAPTETGFKVSTKQLPPVPYLPPVIEVTAGWLSIPNDVGATTLEEFNRKHCEADYTRMLNLLSEDDLKTAEFAIDQDGERNIFFYTENTEALQYALGAGFLEGQATVEAVAKQVASGLPAKVQRATAEKIETYDYKFRAGLAGAYLVRSN